MKNVTKTLWVSAVVPIWYYVFGAPRIDAQSAALNTRRNATRDATLQVLRDAIEYDLNLSLDSLEEGL